MLFLAAALFAKSNEPIDCAKLPAPVQKAAAPTIKKSQSKPACERISEGAKILFEVKITNAAGRMEELVYLPTGVLEESEEEVPAETVPAAAHKAIREAVGSGELRKIDRIQRGKLTLYEGEYTVNGVKQKVIVDVSGTPHK